ncbi:hypothetical protein HYH03_015308 [Edaphochlamys debaryana]|uniref:Uncharacterized protein n=1 Tax=Edaphochlamys debaryana TaxID=47281 RepID=A0A835XM54_9CHLO|nr:hypothetical protein HYH03_015308 [Edaphochlamys debaryana]|eukprot:KAG2485985.1 hypothetical protein HYH03_015308 [Edaphochlamys debaryana]
MPLSGLGIDVHKSHHVGLEKYKIVHHDFNHFTLGPTGKDGKGGQKISFTLQEPEQLNPSFNVLYVRTQKPGVFRLPLVKLLMDTWAETVELVRPVFRFGIPVTSLRNKCKYWRDDGSSLPTTPNLQMQRLIKAIDNEQFGSTRNPQFYAAHHWAGGSYHKSHKDHGPGHGSKEAHGKAHAGPLAHGHAAAHKDHGHGQGHKGPHHLTAFQEKEEFVELVTPWVVVGLNVVAWCWLGSTANKPPPGM